MFDMPRPRVSPAETRGTFRARGYTVTVERTVLLSTVVEISFAEMSPEEAKQMALTIAAEKPDSEFKRVELLDEAIAGVKQHVDRLTTRDPETGDSIWEDAGTYDVD